MENPKMHNMAFLNISCNITIMHLMEALREKVHGFSLLSPFLKASTKVTKVQ